MKRASKSTAGSSSKSARVATSTQRVNDYGRESYCTPAAKAKLMKQIRDEGLPAHFSSTTHSRQRHDSVGRLLQYVGLERDDGRIVQCPFLRPAMMLQEAATRCPPFAALLDRAMQQRTAATASLVLYFDEVEPADPLKKGDRKLLAIYWSLEEFGEEALANEDCWFTLACIRTSIADNLKDGYCQVMCHVLDLFFVNECSFKDGVVFVIPRAGDDARTYYTCLKFSTFVSDEKAIKQLTGVKGASGRKPCLFCMNVKNWRFFKDDPTGFHVPSTCLNRTAPGPRIVLHSDESLKETYRKVMRAQATLGSTAFIEYQREMGFTLNEKYHPILRDEFLPISTISWDPLHVYFSDGMWDTETEKFVDSLEALQCSLGYAELDAFLQEWTWPKAYATGAHICKLGKLQGPASSYMSAAPVVAKWVTNVVIPSGCLPAECESMLKLSHAVELVQMAIHGTCDSDELDTGVLAHLAQQQTTYGPSIWKAKNCHAIHLGDQCRNKKRLYACFTHERKHKEPKRFAAPRVNTTSYETGLLEELTDQQLWSLGKPLLASTLATPRLAPKHMRETVIVDMGWHADTEVWTSPDVRVRGQTVRMRDVALLMDHTIAEIWFFFGSGDDYFACVSRWPILRVITPTTLAVDVREAPQMVRLRHILGALIYRRSRCGRAATVLLPLAFRNV